MKEQYVRWYSPNLGADLELIIYGDRGFPVIVFPSSMGRYYESKDFGLVQSASWYLQEGLVQLFCVDSVDKHSWYNRSVHPAHKVRNHMLYDKMLADELVPRIRWNTPMGKVAVAGASFGGYHAANFAFRHPDLVSHMFSMSGAFSIKSFMDGHYDDNVYFNSPTDFLPSLQHPDLWKMDIVLGTSEWDICLEANLEMARILRSKHVPHWFDVRGWKEHDWPLWREMFPHYLSRLF